MKTENPDPLEEGIPTEWIAPELLSAQEEKADQKEQKEKADQKENSENSDKADQKENSDKPENSDKADQKENSEPTFSLSELEEAKQKAYDEGFLAGRNQAIEEKLLQEEAEGSDGVPVLGGTAAGIDRFRPTSIFDLAMGAR